MMIAGVPIRRLLAVGDQVEFVVLQALARKVDEIEGQRREDLANRIVNGVSKILGGTGG